MGVGQGGLEPNEKYVVVLEFYGPADPSVTKDLRNALTEFLRRFGAQEKVDVRAIKRKADPETGLPAGAGSGAVASRPAAPRARRRPGPASKR